MLKKYLLSALLAFALVAFAGWKGYKLGKENERAVWLATKVIEVAQASAKIKQLEDEARASESLHAVKLANISNDLNGVIHDIETLNDSVSNGARNVARVRFGIDTLQARRSDESAVSAPTRECNGETITEFSPGVFRYVYDGFTSCDEIVEQLDAAQALILEDRRVCNTP